MSESGPDIEYWYEKYGPMVLRRCRYLLKNEEEALDVMQEVFVRLLKRDRLKKNLHNTGPSSLLHTTATNLCLNRIRDSKRHAANVEHTVLESIAVQDDSSSRLHIQDYLERFFHREEVSTRTIAVLHMVDGLTLGEVAEQVNMSVSGVRKRIRKLKERASMLGKEEMYD